MNDTHIARVPARYEAILHESQALNFSMPSDKPTGALLRMLAASKPGGSILELGTGTGLGAAWLLDGMDAAARLVSVESHAEYQAIARKHLADDGRVSFYCGDGLAFLEQCADASFDLIYADTWPGKFTGFEHSLRILRPGGVMVMDDLLPQPNWPADHPPKVAALLRDLEALPPDAYAVVCMAWQTGHVLLSKR